MNQTVVSARMDALRAQMAELGVRAFVVRDVANIAWLTGFEGVFDDERAHTLVVTEDRAVLHTDSRYSAAMRIATRMNGSRIVIDDKPHGVSAFVDEMLAADDKHRRIAIARAERAAAAEAEGVAVTELPADGDLSAIELPCVPFAIEDDITLREFRAIQELEAARTIAPVETNKVVKNLRAVKTAEELERLQRAQDVTDACFEHIKGYVQPGMTEREIQLEMDDFMAWSGAQSTSFATIVAFGANAAKPHHVPTETKLCKGQALLLDFGAKVDGYCSDMTRCIFLGEPSPYLRRVYDAVVAANEEVEAMLKPGVTGIEAQELAESVLAKRGYPGKMGHGLGHGVGMEVHEEPCLNLRNDKPLEVGNVVTVEPGIYLPDGIKNEVNLPMAGRQTIELLRPTGIRVEDCGVITEEGFRVFTKTSHEIVII